jgi:protease I
MVSSSATALILKIINNNKGVSMPNSLQTRKILVLVSNGVDEAVMSSVQRELVKTGAIVKTVGTESGLVNSWNGAAANGGSWGLYFPVDQHIGVTLGADFDALIVPSGARSIQKLGQTPHAERILASFIMAQKPMAFIGDAVELLAKTELAKGWTVSGPEKSQVIMEAAGAEWKAGGGATVHNILMTGASDDMLGMINEMLVHLAQTAEMKAAA